MSSELYTRKRRTSSDDSLIAMINIIFLLLVFFMITGQIKASGNPELTLPFSPLGTQAELQPLKIEIDGNRSLTVNGAPMELAQLDSALGEMDRTTARVALLADKRLTAVELDEVLSLIRARGIARVTLFSESKEAP